MITWGQQCLWERGRRLSQRRALGALGGAGHPGQLAQGFGLLSTGTREQPWGLA